MPDVVQQGTTLFAGQSYTLDQLFDYTLEPGAYNESFALIQYQGRPYNYTIAGAPAIESSLNGNPVYLWRFQIAGGIDPDLDGAYHRLF